MNEMVNISKSMVNVVNTSKNENVLVNMTDEQLNQLRSNLEFELYNLDMLWKWNYGPNADEGIIDERDLYDYDDGSAFILYNINVIDSELIRRGIPNEWMKV